MSTRREFIAVAAALPVAAQHEQHTEVAAAYTLKVFSPEERARVATLVDQIIPRTDM